MTQLNDNALFLDLFTQKGKVKDQIYLTIKELILNGKISTGAKLPSSRNLAEMLSISRNSVIAGFDRLMDEGYLISKKGSGTYVVDEIPDEFIHVKSQAINYREVEKVNALLLPNMTSQAISSIWQNSSPFLSQNQLFSIGVGCKDLFPYKTWGRLLNQAWKNLKNNIHLLEESMGYLPLRSAIAKHIQLTRGVECDEHQILIVSGTQQAMTLTALVLLSKDDLIWMDEPGYDSARAALTITGAKTCAIFSDQDGMNISYGINHYPNAKLAFTAPSHQYPLGGTLSLKRRIALLTWAAKNNKWIFEDDYNSEFRFSARPIQSLQGIDKNQRVIYAGTFSKMMFPGLRLGFMVIPPALINSFKAIKEYTDSKHSYLEQATLASFISEGFLAHHLRKVRKTCFERKNALNQAINQHLSDYFTVEPTDSGIHLVCWLKRLSEEVIIQACLQLGFGAQPLSIFYQAEHKKQGILLGFAAHTPQELEQGVKLLAKKLREM